MGHVVERTSPKGGPFIGQCMKCGAKGLGMGAALEDCPMDDAFTADEDMQIAITGRIPDEKLQ